MNYIVFDLEWNQSSEEEAEETKGLPFEIIEIGAVKLNSNKKIISQFSKLIKPQMYHELHYITKKLIHLQMEDLENEQCFVDIMKEFLEWCGEDYIFCTWGPLDLLELQRNMKHYGMPVLAEGPFPFLDIQKLFSIAFEDKKSRRTLEYAVDYLKIEKDIPFHRAFSDAYYTAKVFGEMKDEKVEKNVSFDVYSLPKDRKSEIKVTFDNYAKYISREFEDKQAAMANREVISTKCYFCHKNLRKKIRWFSTNGKHYLSVSYCDKHGPMKAKIRLRKSENNKVYVVKTLKFISWNDVENIKKKKENAKKIKE
ncbi:MAG: exonuclease domain-containing protein [Lachnospiraceae bacterium]|nr:exonuclease domain-containing protein [Lachnospiraceae bacterium]